MQIASRVSMWSGARTPTAKDYVQSGLIAMWDGIENAGWGVHDASATVWKDLISGVTLKIQSASHWENDALFIDRAASRVSTNVSGTAFYTALSNAVDARTLTIQNVWNLYEYGTSAGTGLGERVRRVMGPAGAIYGFLCPITATHVYLNSNGSGSGYYWTSNINIGDVAGKHSLTAAFAPSGVRMYASLYHNATLLQNKVLPTSQVADEDVSFSGLKSATWYMGAFSNIKNIVDEIHCFRMYSRDLTAAEIAANYAIDKARFGLP